MTSGLISSVLRAVRCAHRVCLTSGNGYMLFELSGEYENICVTALPEKRTGFDVVERCKFCRGWNGVTFSKRQRAA